MVITAVINHISCRLNCNIHANVRADTHTVKLIPDICSCEKSKNGPETHDMTLIKC